MSDLGNKRIMGDNIQYYLDREGITRRDFAKAIGVPYSTLTEWINGRAYPRIDKIEIMARYFGIEKSDLVERQPDASTGDLDLFARVRKLSPEQKKVLVRIMDALDM